MPRVLLPLAMLLSLAVGLLSPTLPADAHGPARAAVPLARTAVAATDDPLAGRPWGVYEGTQDQSWQPYESATGTQKSLLGYIALTPKMKWFGAWIPTSQVTAKIAGYVANAQHGDPTALVQMAVFRMVPWEHAACTRLPTMAERTAYRHWIDGFAAGVGNAYAAIVLQPDGPFALCAPGGSHVPSDLIAYSAKVLSALPHTSVYIEAGAADWPAGPTGADTAVKILVRGGIRYARGFALNSTHYDSTVAEVARAAAIAQRLAALGYPGRKAVINTSSNGHPFDFGSYAGSDAANARVCPSTTAAVSSTCVTLGIPPTTAVGASRWGLPAETDRLARQYVDAYMWIGRPWLHDQNSPFVTSRALQLVRTTPFR